jgi:hypothetical protein
MLLVRMLEDNGNHTIGLLRLYELGQPIDGIDSLLMYKINSGNYHSEV